MTSQLNVDTIVDKAGSGGSNVKMANTSTYVSDGGATTQNTVQGIAKAWVLGDEDTNLTNSFNIASGTDNGTGDYTYTFTNAMSSANFTSHVTGMHNARRYGFSEARTTTTNRLDYRDENGLSANCDNSSAIHGDLA